MSLLLTQSKTALGAGLTASFLAVGGTAPYVYSVRQNPQGAGGTINSTTGIYTAPPVINGGAYGKPDELYDTVVVRDNVGAQAISSIFVGSPLLLFCEIIQRELNLKPGRVYLWDQKIMQPTDSGLYVAISVLSCKPFANTNQIDPATGDSIQSVNMLAQLQIDIISRDTEARDRKEDVLLAIGSTYAQQQQQGNSFLIGKLPPGSQFVNLSSPDGAAIPYRFSIAVAIQYFYTKAKSADYFDNYPTLTTTINS